MAELVPLDSSRLSGNSIFCRSDVGGIIGIEVLTSSGSRLFGSRDRGCSIHFPVNGPGGETIVGADVKTLLPSRLLLLK